MTVHGGGVRFRVYPQDHEPMHVHARYGETIAIVELAEDGTVNLANRKDRLIPKDAKASDVRKILAEAANYFDELVAAWEQMQ